MYKGVPTFYRERINEFMNVAKSLQIKEISLYVEFYNEQRNANDVPDIPQIVGDCESDD